MLAYLFLVCIVSAILPFTSGRIEFSSNVKTKSQIALAMGRMIRHYEQTGNKASLHIAQAYAQELQSMGAVLRPATIEALNG